MDGTYTLSELAELAGISSRTIRYYIAEGLLPSPPQGRSSFYTGVHLDLLRRIKEEKAKGLSLAWIKKVLLPSEAHACVRGNLSTWETTLLREDVGVVVRSDASRKRKMLVSRVLVDFARALDNLDTNDKED